MSIQLQRDVVYITKNDRSCNGVTCVHAGLVIGQTRIAATHTRRRNEDDKSKWQAGLMGDNMLTASYLWLLTVWFHLREMLCVQHERCLPDHSPRAHL